MIRVDVPGFVAKRVQAMEDRKMWRADRVLITSEGRRKFYLDRGFPMERMEMIMNCKPWKGGYEEDVGPIKIKYGLEGKFTLVYIGTFGEGRFLRELLEVSRDFTNERLLLGGFGDLKGHIEENLNDNVVYLGPVEPGDVPRYLAASDLGICIYHPTMENQNIEIVSKFFDYVNMGLPCIANSELRETAKIIEENGCGLVVPYGKSEFLKALRGIETEPDKLREMAQAMRSLQSVYSWDAMKGRLLAVYNGLAGK